MVMGPVKKSHDHCFTFYHSSLDSKFKFIMVKGIWFKWEIWCFILSTYKHEASPWWWKVALCNEHNDIFN